MKVIPTNLPDLEESCPIFLLTKSTKITRVPTIDVSNFAPGFMIQIYFSFFNVVSIYRFISNIVAVCYDTSQPFGFPFICKHMLLDILKLLFTTLSNQDKKASFIQVDEYGALERSYNL